MLVSVLQSYFGLPKSLTRKKEKEKKNLQKLEFVLMIYELKLGRYFRPRIPREHRICVQCSKAEDEEHVSYFVVQTVDSCNLEVSDSLKHFEIYVLRHIKFAELRKTINRKTTFHKWVHILTPKVRDIVKLYCGKEEKWLLSIVEKRRNGSLGAISPLFHSILLPFYVKTGQIFFFEINGYSR